MTNNTNAKEFWVNQDFYPNYPFVKERRKHEVDMLLKHIPINAKSLLDLGCGNGSTTILLRELTYIEDYYCYDISPSMLSKIGPDRDSQVHPFAFDVNTDVLDFPAADVSICMNMFPYVFSDERLDEIIKAIKSDIFIVRITCDTERLEINNFSKDLGKEYSAIYRTFSEYRDVLIKYFKEVEISRAFPDEIESKFNSKQYFFICKR